MKAFQEYLIGIKGPLTTPVGGGIRYLNVALRQTLDLYVCLRRARWFEGVHSPVMSGTNLTREAELPEAVLRYDHAEGHPFHPMPQGIPVSLAYRQLLLLKAETAFRLHLYLSLIHIFKTAERHSKY